MASSRHPRALRAPITVPVYWHPGLCGCGCGAPVTRLFRQGHDQRLITALSRCRRLALQVYATKADYKKRNDAVTPHTWYAYATKTLGPAGVAKLRGIRSAKFPR